MQIAEREGGEIISADSRQVYRGMDVGTAKPTSADRARVAHHLIDVGDEVSDMVKRSVRGATERDRMMFSITAQKDHLPFAPIGDSKAKYFCVKFYHRFNLRGVKDDMTNGMRLHALGLPLASMLNDAGAQLNAAALRINESKAISSPRLVQGLRLRY